MEITSFGGTDPGKRRSNNEDSYLVNDELLLYAVADGIGGSEGGEVASRIAVDTLAGVLPDLLGEEEQTPSSILDHTTDTRFSALRKAITLTNLKIREARSTDPQLRSMGTTLTAVLLRKKHALIVNVGDSRAYLLRSGLLHQLTLDHSLVAEHVAAGLLTPDEARVSSYRHIITRALGIDEVVQADFMEHLLQPDDRILLCTDGLTEMLKDPEILMILSTSLPHDAVQKLLAAANDNGGVDNITAVVVWVMNV